MSLSTLTSLLVGAVGIWHSIAHPIYAWRRIVAPTGSGLITLAQRTQPHLLGADLTLSCLQVHTPVRINVSNRPWRAVRTMVILQMSTKFLIGILRVPRMSRVCQYTHPNLFIKDTYH